MDTEKECVDLIASGYEWTCPKCGRLNKVIEWKSKVICGDDEGVTRGCGKEFETESPDHAYED